MKIKQCILSVIAVGLASSIILSGCSSANKSASSDKVSSANVHANTSTTHAVNKEIVSVAIDKNAGNLKLCEAVKVYLEKESYPKVFKSFTIVKVIKDNKGPMGTSEWVISLNVHHQPGRTSPYNEGMNKRIIGFTEKDGSYIVTDLATGG